MAGTPEPFTAETDFQDEATKLSEKIKSPEMETAAAQAEVRVLQLRAALDKNPGRKAKMDELVRDLRAREDADGALTDIKARTAKGNPEWDGIVKAIKSKEGTPAEQAQQLTKAKDLIAQSFVDIKTIDAAADKPYNYLSQIEAHNANVVKTKSLDTKNFDLEGSEGVDPALLDGADIDLKNLETDHGTYMLSLEPLLKTAEGIKSTDNPAGRKAAEEIVDANTKTQKTALEAKIKNILTFAPPQFNAEKQIAAVLANMKNIDDVVNTRLGRKPVKTPNAEPNAPATSADKINVPATKLEGKVENDKITVTVEPKDADIKVTKPDGSVKVEKAVNGSFVIDKAPNGTYKFESGGSTFAATIDMKNAPTTAANAPTLSPAETAKVDAVKVAIIKGDKAEIEKSLEDFNKLPSTPEKQTRVDAINKALAAALHTKTHATLDSSDKIVIVSGSPVTPNSVVEPTKADKKGIARLIEIFEQLLAFLRGDALKNGGIGALKAEVLSIDEQIAKIKKDNPDFSKKPELTKQITDLEVKRNELQRKIDDGIKIGSRVVDDANRFINGSPNPLFVRAGKDRQGNPYLMCTRNTPEARGHMQYMTGRLQQIHPGLGLNQQAAVDQRVYFHFHGDVNINSNNDNRRTIDNRTKVEVKGDNNKTKVQVSADGSQSGDNANEGGVGATQDGTAKNKIKVPTEPVKPKLSVPVELPPMSGSL